MLVTLKHLLSSFCRWSNANQGILSLGIFATTLFLGWISGIFASLRKKPKFKVDLIPGPTFCCTFETGGKYSEYVVHRTAIALYLSISNVGSAASSIHNISVGYHWQITPFSWQWLRYRIGWFWLNEQAAALEEFQSKIGEQTKVYPFLIQVSATSHQSSETYLQIGKSTNGVVYFEQEDSWGGCFPVVEKSTIAVKVIIKDVFNYRHATRFHIPSVTLEQARKFNPSFGKTLAEYRGETLPFDSDPGKS